MSHHLSERQHIDAVKATLGYKEFIVMIATLMATNAIAIDIMLPAMSDMSLSLKMSGQNDQHYRSEERRVGKECRSRRGPQH